MVLLTFTIGVLNLCLGYGLAVRVGLGPPSLLDAWDALSMHLRDRPSAADRDQVDEAPADEASAEERASVVDD